MLLKRQPLLVLTKLCYNGLFVLTKDFLIDIKANGYLFVNIGLTKRIERFIQPFTVLNFKPR